MRVRVRNSDSGEISPAFTMTDGDPRENIVEAIITDASRRRMLELYRAQLPDYGGDLVDAALEQQMRENPPEQYVVRYYVRSEEGMPIGRTMHRWQEREQAQYQVDLAAWQAAGSVPEDRPPYPVGSAENPLVATNDNMEQSILASFAVLQAQFPGRFVFQPVADPTDADIAFYAETQNTDRGGAGSLQNGTIVLNAESYSGSYSAQHTQLTTHEILHGLFGIEHAHDYQKTTGEEHVNDTSYLSSTMTYDENNALSRNGGLLSTSQIGSGLPTAYAEGLPFAAIPVTIAPGDVIAIGSNLPIQADLRHGAVIIGNQQNLASDITLQSDGRTSYVLPEPISALMHAQVRDTTNDVLNLADNPNQHLLASRQEYLDFMYGNTDGSVTPQGEVFINQRETGVVVTRTTPDTISRVSGSTTRGGVEISQVMLNGVDLEQIDGSNRNERIYTRGDVHFIADANSGHDTFEANGDGNLIDFTVGTDNTLGIMLPRAVFRELTVNIHGDPTARTDMPFEFVRSAQESVTWRREPDGSYRIFYPDNDFVGVVTLRFDSTDPVMHARFQANIHQYLGMTSEQVQQEVTNEVEPVGPSMPIASIRIPQVHQV